MITEPNCSRRCRRSCSSAAIGWTPPRAARSRCRTRPLEKSSPRSQIASVADGAAALDAAVEGVGILGGDRSPGARRAAARGLGADPGARGRVRPAHDARDGQAARRGTRRGGVRLRVPAPWSSEEAVRITGRYGLNPDGTGRMIVTQASGWGRASSSPRELPARDGHPQDLAGARGRLHRRDQAGRAHAAHHAALSRGCSRRSGCPPASSTSSRPRPPAR